MQRQFGKLMSKGPGDNAKVAVLLNDYEDADKMLAKIIDASKAWRDAWTSILSVQLGIVADFEELYDPIVGASDGHGHPPFVTPQVQLDRTYRLKEAYTELKTDLLEEVNMMDSRVIKPATEAKEYIQPVRKTIKKRENKRLDYERYQDRVTNALKKQKRSDRENAALAKAEDDLTKASEEFNIADAHLRETLPPIIAAAFSILPHLLAAQIMTQNTLLAQYYTILHTYCEEHGFPSPPPPMEEVIAVWSQDFKPIQQQVESITCIARGKAVHQPMALGDDPNARKSSSTLGVRNGLTAQRASSQGMISPGPTSPNPNARIMRIPSSNSIPQSTAVISPPAPSPEPEPEPEPTTAFTNPDYSTHLSPQSFYSAHSPAGPKVDYFSRERTQSSNGLSAVGKKKPPPPPPKRIGSNNTGLFVIALYAFDGQGHGDLSFAEGDRIKVIKKTDSTDDWWEGELRGVKGSFPANYCKSA
jgi:hypothetical protein